jgi:phosphocarrier protein
VLEGMVEKTIVIKNKLGLHARAAVKFVNMANRYSSSVKIIRDETEIDGKSILGILTLAAIQGTSIILRISGKDENDAFKALEELVKDKFGERE